MAAKLKVGPILLTAVSVHGLIEVNNAFHNMTRLNLSSLYSDFIRTQIKLRKTISVSK